MQVFSTSTERNVLIVGLTGGIGSGKSTLAKIFEGFGIPVFSADEAAKNLYLPGSAMLEWIALNIGPECVLREDGRNMGVDKKTLAERVFQQPDQLQALNQQVHPLVQRAFSQWFEKVMNRINPPYVLREAAILFESGSAGDCDRVITVEAPESLRLQRASARSGLSPEEIRHRMRHQWTDEERAVRADFVVQNGEWDALLPQALKIHTTLTDRFSSNHQSS
jgi:dephospho-CoA kinase